MELTVSKANLLSILFLVNIVFGTGEPAKFLWMGTSAEHLAIGNTGAAYHTSLYATYYNPALVSSRGATSIGFGNQFLSLGRILYYASLSSEISGGAGIGLTWIHSSVDDVEQRDIDGHLTGTIGNNQDAIYFAFGGEIHRGFHGGLGVQYVQSNLVNIDAYSAGLAFGFFYDLKKYRSIFGFSVHNISLKYSWNSSNYYGNGNVSNEDFPILIRGGLRYENPEFVLPIAFSSDIWKYETSDINYGLGIEFVPIKNLNGLALRFGLKDGLFSAGFGFKTRITFFQNIDISYAVVEEPYKLPWKHALDLKFELPK